ncbi:MAG: hypothetical protein HDKAJFGB_03051 [Anaerolineae bacterium]|nr:hypothetical protein [Anaerolineae bacterium]
MAIKLGDAILFLAANDKDLAATLNKTEKTVEKFTEKTNTLGGRIGNMFSGSIGKMAAFGAGMFSVSRAFSFAVSEISESQLAAQQLNAVLESTGGIAGVTASQVNNLGTQLASMSNFSDDAIISASSTMLTFTNVTQGVFSRAMQSVVDVATGMNTDLKSAVIQVGKALQDPVRGITALSRAGIQFSSDQREMVKNFVESNDLLSAQGIILTEIEKQFGGSAAAAADTFAGSVQDLTDALGNLAEQLEPVLNLMTRVANGFTSMVQAISSPIEALGLVLGVADEGNRQLIEEESVSRKRNIEVKEEQAKKYGTDLMTAEGIPRSEYDAKYAEAEKAATAEAQKIEQEKAAAAAAQKAKEITPEQRYRIAARAAYASQVRGESEQGPQTMEEAAASERERTRAIIEGDRAYRRAEKEAMAQTIQRMQQRGRGNVIISHANFTAGPDQIRAYNQRRAMMPGF